MLTNRKGSVRYCYSPD